MYRSGILKSVLSAGGRTPPACAAGLLLLFCVFSQAGCNLGAAVGLLASPTDYEKKTPAEYNLAEARDRKILVLVDQPAWLSPETDLRLHITQAMTDKLVRDIRIPAGRIMDYTLLSRMHANQSGLSLLSPAQAGSEVGADMVLFFAVRQHHIEKMPAAESCKASLSGAALLLDVKTGAKLWPESGEFRNIEVGFEAATGTADDAVDRLAKSCAHCTTRYLYNCPRNKFKSSDDRSGSAWQSWD